MMDKEKMKKIIRDSYKLHIEDDDGFEKFKHQVISIVVSDLDGAIQFILKDCTDEEFFWMSSFFEDVIAASHSLDFYNAIKIRLQKVTKESYCHNTFESELMRNKVSYKDFVDNIQMEIDYAEGQLWQLEDDSSDQQ